MKVVNCVTHAQKSIAKIIFQAKVAEKTSNWLFFLIEDQIQKVFLFLHRKFKKFAPVSRGLETAAFAEHFGVTM